MTDTCRATNLLAQLDHLNEQQWCHLLVPERAKRNMAYTKPTQPSEQQSLLSEAEDNKLRE